MAGYVSTKEFSIRTRLYRVNWDLEIDDLTVKAALRCVGEAIDVGTRPFVSHVSRYVGLNYRCCRD
jgi:hypothetical protein